MIPIRDDNPTRRPAITVAVLMLVNLTAFLYELSLPPALLKPFVFTYGLVPVEFWRLPDTLSVRIVLWRLTPLITYQFLHGGWFHFLGNMWVLWIFGDNIEDRLGHIRFLLFYLFCGATGALVHAGIHPGSPLPTIGASGAIAGVMGAYFMLFPAAWITVLVPILFFPLLLRIPAFVFLLFWILLQFVGAYGAPGMTGGIAFWAHVAGFLTGMFCIRRWTRGRRMRVRVGP
ncbi:MAG: rhomboid family intramembrane serine protease [Kiritimatiellaeota bacterium]|nr:rhomboid family intramembrane serine protease [Kiritimatiellota bacterium]